VVTPAQDASLRARPRTCEPRAIPPQPTKAKLDEIAQARGFEGRLVVLSDAAMAPGDCSIEWADGGVARDHAAILAAIDDVVTRYVAARLSATK